MPSGQLPKSHEQYLQDLTTKNPNYKSGWFWVKSKYLGAKIKILCEDKYGELLCSPSTLLRGHKPNILSAVNKTLYLKNMLLDINDHYQNKEFEVIGDYVQSRIKILCRDKYGDSLIPPNALISEKSKPSLHSAINKTQYYINKVREVHGDRYNHSPTIYKNDDGIIDVICGKHGLFSLSAGSHSQGTGCRKCANEQNAIDKANNQTGWTCTDWRNAGKRSKNFDSNKAYFIKVWNKYELFYKIGKTFTTVERRFDSTMEMPYKFKVLKTIVRETAEEICELETELKKLHKGYKYLPKIKFYGQYECFSKIDWEIVAELTKKK